VVRVGDRLERISIDEGPAPDGAGRRVGYERESDGSVTAIVDHIDGDGAVVDTFRPARWSSEKLISIEIVES
jgi:hypothetical protein